MSTKFSILAMLAWLATGAGGAAAAVPSEQPSPYRLMQWPAGAASPRFALRDAAGHRRTLGDFHGRTILVFFGFMHCPDACPTQLYKLAQVLRAPDLAAAPPQVLFITLDPGRDAPQRLQNYVAGFNRTFVGLSGSQAQIQQAADSFGVQFARVPQGADYTIDHSTATYIFDGAGHLRLVAPLDASQEDLVHDLRQLAAQSPSP